MKSSVNKTCRDLNAFKVATLIQTPKAQRCMATSCKLRKKYQHEMSPNRVPGPPMRDNSHLASEGEDFITVPEPCSRRKKLRCKYLSSYESRSSIPATYTSC
jgi:hypothetical protein